jgi:pimeloyl-ACP methyl ester carboxylesterase
MLTTKSFIIKVSLKKEILLDVTFNNNSLKKQLIIFSHGFKGFKDWGPFNTMAKSFANENFFFLKFNFSHNGTSVDDPCNFIDLESFGNNNFSLELDDLNLVIDWIINNDSFTNEININKINLLGHSRGGAISILKAAEDNRIKKIISWASPSDFTNRLDNSKISLWKEKGVAYVFNSRTNQNMPMYYQFYEDCIKNSKRIDIKIATKNLSIPHLVVHGTDDPTVSIIDAHDFKKWNLKTEIFEIKDANHVFGIMHPYSLDKYPKHFQITLDKTFEFLKA